MVKVLLLALKKKMKKRVMVKLRRKWKIEEVEKIGNDFIQRN